MLYHFVDLLYMRKLNDTWQVIYSGGFCLRDVPELHFGVKVNLVQSATLPQTDSPNCFSKNGPIKKRKETQPSSKIQKSITCFNSANFYSFIRLQPMGFSMKRVFLQKNSHRFPIRFPNRPNPTWDSQWKTPRFFPPPHLIHEVDSFVPLPSLESSNGDRRSDSSVGKKPLKTPWKI